jgi:signal peptidase I
MSTKTTSQNNNFNFWSFFWTILWLLLLVVVIFKFVIFQQVTVVGKSMQPNYEDGQLLLVNQIDKNFKRGQVVAVYEDRNIAKNADYFTRFSARFFLKRIIGLPNEEIEVVGSKVIIYNAEFPNGAVLQEDYIPQNTKNSEEQRNEYFPRTKISDIDYFVMGDNRSNSTDSRSKNLGPIANFAMFGQETTRLLPSIELFDLPSYEFLPIDEKTENRRQQLIKSNKEIVRIDSR